MRPVRQTSAGFTSIALSTPTPTVKPRVVVAGGRAPYPPAVLLTETLLIATLFTTQPTPDQVKAVFDYHYQGQGQELVLSDALLCKTIEKKDKARKNDCVETYGASADKGELVQIYLMGVLPKGAKADLMIQAVHEGVVRSTKDVTMEGSYIRSRTWTGFSLKKPGTWEFRVMQGTKVLKTLTLEAT